ncbi:aph [Symbiodinium natans]|uniref:Aph protein n=1 Tax=Symbiodinium natans TaxID=878477 RepID=A0A812LXL1_9DINO|nr:aph [Symbiodinium natans]
MVEDRDQETALRQAYTAAAIRRNEELIAAEIEGEALDNTLELEFSNGPLKGPEPIGEALQVTVWSMSGAMLCRLSLSASATGGEVMQEAAKASAIRQSELKLFYKDRELAAKMPLGDLYSGSSMDLSLLHIDPEWQTFMEVVSYAGCQLAVAPARLQADKPLVLRAVRQNGCALEYAAQLLREDIEVVLAAVQDNGHSLEFAGERLRDDREVVHAAVTQNGNALRFASTRLQGNTDLVLAAVASGSQAFQFASPALRCDRKVVLAAVDLNGLSLEFASQQLKEDREAGVEEQLAEVQRVLSAVTEPKVSALCASLGLELLTFDFLPEGEPGCTFGEHEGCTARPFNVNPNWALSVREKAGRMRALILQVSNPHAWRKARNTESKVAAMRLLRQKGVPLIPEVLGWSADTGSSELGAEYLLMERVPGVGLDSILDSASEEQRQSYISQLATWLQAVGTLKCPGALQQVSGFRIQGDGATTGVEWAVNGPPLPLRDGFAAFALEALDDVVARIKEDAAAGWEVDREDMLPSLAEVRRFILHYRAKYEATPESILDACADFGVCHGDLHPGNVMCDPESGKLTGIIDWENVSWGPREPDICASWLGDRKSRIPERGMLCKLLEDLRFLHFFSVTWWGHCITLEKKLQGHADEARNCASDARKALETFLASARPLLEQDFHGEPAP